MPPSHLSNQHLILSPAEWRELLRDELVAQGFGRDAAGVIARSVIEHLVRRYLGEAPPIDRAA
jgi:hypothetical protein